MQDLLVAIVILVWALIAIGGVAYQATARRRFPR